VDVLPAIDIRNGSVVRLQQGDYGRQKTYADDPPAVAERYIAAGASWLHVVDLDAARSGELTHTDVIEAICARARQAGAKVQSGGGVRNSERIRRLQQAGAERVVIGSAAMKHWAWFAELLDDEAVPNAGLALGLDAREGRLTAEGWTEALDLRAVDLAGRVRGSGLGAIVYTDIDRDGMLSGINAEATAEIIAATDVPVIASGGAGSLEDIRTSRRIGCRGVILGKALYEGRINLSEALAAARS